MYVDDMLIKSKSLDDHLANLEENFLVMKHNKVRINPTKCLFGVANRKFLRFMLIGKPNKVQGHSRNMKSNNYERGPKIERLNYGVVLASKRLKHYFELIQS